jgi:hypothetical protein
MERRRRRRRRRRRSVHGHAPRKQIIVRGAGLMLYFFNTDFMFPKINGTSLRILNRFRFSKPCIFFRDMIFNFFTNFATAGIPPLCMVTTSRAHPKTAAGMPACAFAKECRYM